jgi:glutamate-1-semialdehyde aminotransferase
MTPGVEEEWTLSIAHGEADLQRFADAFEAFARDVTAS